MDEKTQWPPSAEALGDTTLCPSCFTELIGIACPACGLRLDAPAAERLLEHVRHMLAADARRHALVAEIRVENLRVAEARRIDAERATADRRAREQAAQDRADASGWVAAAAPPPAYRATFAPAPTSAVATGPVRRRSTVQILLLAVGIVLVSVTAIFFALIAFLVTSASVRAVLLLLIAGGVFATARGLRRRLPGTAEGIATLAIVLVALDGLLVRAQGLFGSGGVGAGCSRGCTPAGWRRSSSCSSVARDSAPCGSAAWHSHLWRPSASAAGSSPPQRATARRAPGRARP
ncbi:hypothetical protein GCM10025867_05950 [Frondihabitans sucicola]|uniref:Zinc ribbon domain-containing protein n=1 Tax=Frondihabitans sucicola TaxID=1268041 RepID=A0ABM8GIZ7_9MICO|nr:hypothetical protein [Frondihabitans sucicola]BDZ48354.1 hypothetical protein GCM10025867_05950 [Frondihabitans sucicola]